MRIRRSYLPLFAVALLGVLAAAPSALAVGTNVRLEANDFTVVPGLDVNEGAGGGTYTDTDGDEFATNQATAFGATAVAAAEWGVTWDFSNFGFGPFVNSFARQESDPTTFANWWAFVVNGYSAPVGAATLPSVKNDEYLWFQNADATFSLPSYGLVVGGGDVHTILPGEDFDVTVKLDDLAKVNSQADADRFGVGPGDIETPAQFADAADTTVYVGSVANAIAGKSRTTEAKTYDVKSARGTISGIANGTYWVWAEKAMDANGVYARSEAVVLNVGKRPGFGYVKARPTKYKRNRRLTIQYRLNKKATVRWKIKSAKGKTLAKGVRNHRSGGKQSFTWRGRTRKQLGRYVTVYLRAIDDWGRSSTVKKYKLRVRR